MNFIIGIYDYNDKCEKEIVTAVEIVEDSREDAFATAEKMVVNNVDAYETRFVYDCALDAVDFDGDDGWYMSLLELDQFCNVSELPVFAAFAEWATVTAAAKAFGVTVQRVYQLVKAGTVSEKREGGRKLVSTADMRAWADGDRKPGRKIGR